MDIALYILYSNCIEDPVQGLVEYSRNLDFFFYVSLPVSLYKVPLVPCYRTKELQNVRYRGILRGK